MKNTWDKGKNSRTRIGRLGDTHDFASLPSQVQTVEMATLLGAVGSSVASSVYDCVGVGLDCPTLKWGEGGY